MRDDVQYKGWVIETRSFESDGARWRPYAVAITHVGRSTREHYVSALPDIVFDTEQEANAYAIAMAKKWIDDQG